MTAKRLDDREYDSASRCLNGISCNPVELSVGKTFLMGIQLVEVHDLNQKLLGDGAFVDVVGIDTDRVGEILDLHGEVRLLKIGDSQRVDVLHHEVPNGMLGIACCRFQQFHIEGL